MYWVKEMNTIILLIQIFLIGFIQLLIYVKIYYKLTTRWCKNNVCLVGKTVIVTGANSGIGYETAKELAKRGAKIILACMNDELGEQAYKRILNETGNSNIYCKKLDLRSFKSITNFCKEIYEKEDRLDILINNAGIGFSKDELTEDGLQMMIQVNYHGHFLLTNLLLGLLSKTSSSRIVNVSSVTARFADPLVLEKLNQFSSCLKLYIKSKLCLMLFTIELALKLKHSSISVFSVNPGGTKTNLSDNLIVIGFLKKMVTFFMGLTIKTPIEGAQTTIYCATEKDIEHLSGQHFDECRLVKRYKCAKDPSLAKRLWKKTAEDVKLKNLMLSDYNDCENENHLINRDELKG